ncbi:hypothetical protein [Vreelandella venusta]|uniref:hypothetical protein n=1 Tax=Vreelandella venusta TaxID=44935 RepID=UPI0018DA398E|nr:hypothetical protein [Halomonas venusta]QPI62405.1 hypothetical protein IR195_10885 [Halomonas venusta]
MEITLLKVSTGPDWEYKFKFSWTRYVFGFGFSTPNYATGYYANPFAALKNFMTFVSKRDMKLTVSGG